MHASDVWLLQVYCGARRYKSKKKAFTRYAKKYADGGKGVEEELNQLKKNCAVIRVLAHTQITKIGYGQKKAHLAEIQARGAALFTIVAHQLCCLLCLSLRQIVG
jgi:ribosomal protein L3